MNLALVLHGLSLIDVITAGIAHILFATTVRRMREPSMTEVTHAPCVPK